MAQVVELGKHVTEFKSQYHKKKKKKNSFLKIWTAAHFLKIHIVMKHSLYS
jgi:hypothetical protein